MMVHRAGGFRIILILQDLFQGHAAPASLDFGHFYTEPRRRRILPGRLRGGRALAAVGALSVVAAVAMVSGCNTINPNLGVTPTQTSAVTVINPAAMAAGTQCTPSCPLTVNGNGFVSGSTVTFNNAGLATTFINSTQLTAALTTTNLVNPGTVAVGVTSPGSTKGANAGNNLSNFVAFTIGPANNPIPAITQIAPSSAPVGSATPFTLTVTGSNFISTSQIAWNGSLRATSGSSTQLTTQIVAADIATQGTANVSVVNPGPGGGPSTTKTFTITSTGMAGTSPGEKSVAGANETASVTAISGGSRYVAFVGTDTSASTSVDEIFVRDTCRGAAPGCTPQTTLVSAALIGVEPDGASRSPSISADGRFVVFASDATNLTAGDNNGVADVFLRDTCIGVLSGCTPATSLVSIASDGGSANGASASPSISADGRFVSFDSAATNLVFVGAASDNSSATATVPVGAYLRDTCFGASGACTPSTARLATSSAPQ
jgi:hypothetical protein